MLDLCKFYRPFIRRNLEVAACSDFFWANPLPPSSWLVGYSNRVYCFPIYLVWAILAFFCYFVLVYSDVLSSMIQVGFVHMSISIRVVFSLTCMWSLKWGCFHRDWDQRETIKQLHSYSEGRCLLWDPLYRRRTIWFFIGCPRLKVCSSGNPTATSIL